MDDGSYLLIVDMQNVFAARTPWHVASFGELATPILRWYDKFDMQHVLFSCFLPDSQPIGAWKAYYQRYPFAQPGDATLFELAQPYAELPGECVVSHQFNKWPKVKDVRIKTLYLCGVGTACCVLSTAMAAAEDGVSVKLIREACAPADESARAVDTVIANYDPLIAWV